ncbi:unnamed protein product [Caenorhabditis brenneri]
MEGQYLNCSQKTLEKKKQKDLIKELVEFHKIMVIEKVPLIIELHTKKQNSDYWNFKIYPDKYLSTMDSLFIMLHHAAMCCQAGERDSVCPLEFLQQKLEQILCKNGMTMNKAGKKLWIEQKEKVKSYPVFMVVNRMTCVVVTKPGRYDQMWKKWTPISCFLIAVLPFAGTWNIFLSRVFAVSQRGGFSLGYKKVVKWASISLFQSIAIFFALFFTIICTSITLYNLILLPGRIRSAERSLCFSSIFISITFLLAAGTQMLFHVCPTCDIDSLYIFQFLAFDTFTVGSAVIMILVNKNLRGPIFQGMKRVSIVSSSS